MDYKINNINEEFIRKIVDYLEFKFKKAIGDLEKFNKHLSSRTTPVKIYNPVKKRKEEFSYPLAYNIWILYYFVTDRIGLEYDVEESISSIVDIIKHNSLLDEYDYTLDREKWINSRIGFLVYLAKLKVRLLDGDSFSAAEASTMLGLTGQAVINRIRREDFPMEAEKRGNRFVISNKEMTRQITAEEQSCILNNH